MKSPALAVLLEMASGATTPKHLSLSLDRSPPAIMKQLNYLRKTGWIRLGEKEGKFQHYEIDWDKLISFYLSKAPKLHFIAYYTDSHRVHDLVQKLTQCGRFRELFIHYLMERHSSRKALAATLGFCVTQSEVEIMENFEESLNYLLPKVKRKFKTKEDEELYRLLKEWTEIASKYVPAYRPLESALKTLGFL